MSYTYITVKDLPQRNRVSKKYKGVKDWLNLLKNDHFYRCAPGSFCYSFKDKWLEFATEHSQTDWGVTRQRPSTTQEKIYQFDENTACYSVEYIDETKFINFKNEKEINLMKLKDLANYILVLEDYDDLVAANRVMKKRRSGNISWEYMKEVYGGIEFRNVSEIKKHLEALSFSEMEKGVTYDWFEDINLDQGAIFKLTLLKNFMMLVPKDSYNRDIIQPKTVDKVYNLTNTKRVFFFEQGTLQDFNNDFYSLSFPLTVEYNPKPSPGKIHTPKLLYSLEIPNNSFISSRKIKKEKELLTSQKILVIDSENELKRMIKIFDDGVYLETIDMSPKELLDLFEKCFSYQFSGVEYRDILGTLWNFKVVDNIVGVSSTARTKSTDIDVRLNESDMYYHTCEQDEIVEEWKFFIDQTTPEELRRYYNELDNDDRKRLLNILPPEYRRLLKDKMMLEDRRSMSSIDKDYIELVILVENPEILYNFFYSLKDETIHRIFNLIDEEYVMLFNEKMNMYTVIDESHPHYNKVVNMWNENNDKLIYMKNNQGRYKRVFFKSSIGYYYYDL